MTMTIQIEVGQRFGHLVVINETRLPPNKTQTEKGWAGRRAVRLRCDCGNETTAALSDVTGGKQTSCGCVRDEKTRERARERNKTNNPAITNGLTVSNGSYTHYLGGTWSQMMRRCYDSNHARYKDYGGRGISVFSEWHEAANFIAWVENNIGERPESYTLDRIDNDGNYEPDNVRWASRSTQRRNRRS